MSYFISKKLEGNFDETIEKAKAALKEQGFGILTEIDIKDTLKNKLDVDFRKYRILGACNPPFAYEALQNEDKIGTMLPCNVIVQELENGQLEVAAIDPVASMQAVDNDQVFEIATKVKDRLSLAVSNI